MSPVRAAMIAAAVLVVAVLAWVFWPVEKAPPPVAPPAPVAKVEPPPPPPEHHPEPQPEAPQAKPLPSLDESDKAAGESLAGLIGAQAFARFLVPERLVRHIVVTIDNLPRRTFAMRLSPLKPVGGLMATTGKDESLAIAAANAQRYAPWVAAAAKLDARQVVAAYAVLYPLFQQAYVELGYPDGHFNTRLVQVIDHLLTAPEPAGPVRLVVPKVLFLYADPVLEAESAGRKVLYRMGNANTTQVKAKLREIRRELVKRR